MELLLPHVLERIVDSYLLPKDKMDEVIRHIERMFVSGIGRYGAHREYNKIVDRESSRWFDFYRCSWCHYEGFTVNFGDDGNYCVGCISNEYEDDYPLYCSF